MVAVADAAIVDDLVLATAPSTTPPAEVASGTGKSVAFAMNLPCRDVATSDDVLRTGLLGPHMFSGNKPRAFDVTLSGFVVVTFFAPLTSETTNDRSAPMGAMTGSREA